jgi:CRISPR system Cascade subunit CasA
MDDPFQPDRNLPFGYLDYLTWQNRRILLFPEEREKMTVVRQVTRGPALVFDRSILDPHKLYRLDRKKAPKVLRFNEYRSLWRDSSSLLMLAKSSKPSSFAPPATFRWLHELVQESALDKSRVCRYRALGMANNQARVFFYRDERMPLPLHYLDDESLVFKLTEAADLAEQSGRKLQYAMRTLANLVIKPSCNQKGVPPPDPQYRKRLTQYWAAERTYWAELESPFRTLVVDLPRQSEEALANWYGLIGRAAWDAFEQSAVSAGDDARTLRAAVIARRQLGAGLKKIFSFLEEQTI